MRGCSLAGGREKQTSLGVLPPSVSGGRCSLYQSIIKTEFRLKLALHLRYRDQSQEFLDSPMKSFDDSDAAMLADGTEPRQDVHGLAARTPCNHDCRLQRRLRCCCKRRSIASTSRRPTGNSVLASMRAVRSCCRVRPRTCRKSTPRRSAPVKIAFVISVRVQTAERTVV
jgi:hypothetical protein